MRYYDIAFNTNAEKIEADSRINLKEYGWYRNPFSGINAYMYQNMQSGSCFVIYRNDENTVYSVFAFDEQKTSFNDAYDHLLGMLNDAFLINKIKSDPQEITMYQFTDCFQEGRRRDLTQTAKIADIAGIWFYNYYNNTDKESLRYEFDEFIIPDRDVMKQAISDRSFIRELTNIKEHRNMSDHKGNLVHYVISARSMEASKDMICALTRELYLSNRINSRRIEMIKEIEPGVYKANNHIEDIIENNYGGVVVFDLTEKFGFDPVDYVMTSRYLENLVKRYRNRCLFIFTYNMDRPGFSYQILPNLVKYVIPVMLREGRGSKPAAVKYLKSLIDGSEYAEYSDQAREFMQLYPESDFTQTDILNAFDRFESWCINKNIMGAYNCEMTDEFMLDRDESEISSYDRLKNLVGLGAVKNQIDSILASDIVEKERKRRKGNRYQSSCMHMIFGGNPGSAKTTVAKLFAGIAKEKGILKSGAFVEKGGMDLDGLGCVCAIREAFTAAKGGVLFIDEAYSLRSDVAVTTLIQEMENKRDEVIVILAGYNDRMQEFMKINEGLKSRIPHWIDFPDYTTDELTKIFRMMIDKRGFSVTEDAVREARYIFERVRNTENFGNGRYVRNLIDRALQNQAVRLMAKGKDPEKIKKGALYRITKEDICQPDEGLKEERAPGTARKELDDMIGLGSVKEIIRKAIAHFKLRRMCMDKGIDRGKASMHMVFTGNPGTAKTTVARLFSEIMKDEKVLSTGTFVEVGRADLVGDHVGSTAPIVKKKFKEAQGGVLFIDEAYSLCDSYSNGFGDEAINTLVQEMENHRDDVIVIFAGYPEPMKQFLDRNPGMHSRIAFQVEFDDYDTDELCDITKLMIRNRNMIITDEALDRLRSIYELARKESDYGNGRFVRKMLEEAEMNLAERLSKLDADDITTELLTTIKECDIPIYDSEGRSFAAGKMRIGFAC